MNFVQSIKDGFARCFDFSGRSSRRQFWFFYLFHELATSIAFIIDNVLGLSLHKMPIAEVNLEVVYLSLHHFYYLSLSLQQKLEDFMMLANLAIGLLHNT